MAAVLLGLPWPARVLAALAVLLHALLRRPAPGPATIAVTADGLCQVLAVDGEWRRPGPGTRIAPHWVRLDLRSAAGRLDLLLLADQVDPEQWARLCARLRRVRAPLIAAARGGSGAGTPDLR